MNRIELINTLIKKYDFKRYLEIGVQNGETYNKIRCQEKAGVDPDAHSRKVCGESILTMDSNAFFDSNKEAFDIIFIDGLHLAEQVYDDVINSLKFLSLNGVIVLHDCMPSTEIMQVRVDHGAEWTGDVWKAIARIKSERDDLIVNVIPHDYGLGMIRRGQSIKIKLPFSWEQLTWKDFVQYRDYLLGIAEDVESLI